MPHPSPPISAGVACRLWLSSGLDGIREVCTAGRKFLSEQQVAEPDLAACELALVEACNNAVLYSVDQGREKTIEMRLFCEPQLIEMHVVDHTAGFDWPKDIELPSADAEHGRGLFIIRSMMDEILYQRAETENRLVMKKRRAPPTGAGMAVQIRNNTSELTAAETERSIRASSAPESNGKIGSAIENAVQRSSVQKEPTGTVAPLELQVAEEKLAMKEQVIGAMAKEICVRSEELAAILRSTSELGRTTRIENFAQRLLNDLLHITAADWFVLRLVPRNEQRLAVTNASRSELELPPIALEDGECSESRAAVRREDVLFDEQLPLPGNDPLAQAALNCAGIIRPIVADGKLLGTLAIGRKVNCTRFTADEVQVVRTFTDFLALHVENSRLQQEQVDSRIVAHELEIARNIQQSLLPVRFPRLSGFGLSGFCLSARQVGGDFYDVVPLAQDRVLLIVADVMGKGVPAALFAATMHTLVRTMTEWTHDPAELLSRMNRFLYGELSGVDMFVTAQLVLVDIAADELILASAGHCPLLTANEAGEISSHCPEGMPLGILPELQFENRTVPLNECRCALLYSDGLTDARNAHGEFYGEERLLSWLKENALNGQSAVQLSYGFLRDLKAFQAQVSSPDDQTFLILSREPTTADAEEDLPKGFSWSSPAHAA